MELNSVKETDVLVVGAGPTGLALACDLARRGVRALVVEQSDALFPGSRGKGIQPRTMEVLDDLGVVDAVLASGGTAPVGMVWQNGARQGEHDMFERPGPTDSAPYGEPWLLPQWRTQQILHARLTELGGSVAFGTALTGITQDEHGVSAELSTGTVRAAYAVAADGGRSTVRRALGIAMSGEDVDPAPMLVADVRIPTLDRLNWHVFPGDGAGLSRRLPAAGYGRLPAGRPVHRRRAGHLARGRTGPGRRSHPSDRRRGHRDPSGIGLPAARGDGRALP